jgi:hypothetical protein
MLNTMGRGGVAMRSPFVSLFALFVFACGAGVSPLPEETPEPRAPEVLTLEQRLSAEEVPVLRLVPFDSRGSIEARQVQLDACYTEVSLRATGGGLVVRLLPLEGGSALKLERLDVQLGDIELFDTGLTLTGLHFHLVATDAPRVAWDAERVELYASLQVTMTVSGAFRGPSGVASPFETQTISGVPLELSVTLDSARRVVARFRSQGDAAPSWNWANLLETGAAKFEGRAVEVVAGPQVL